MSLTVIFLVLVILAFFASPALSTSRHALDHHPKTKSGFKIALKRVDSNKNLTKFEQLEHAIKRGKKRTERIHAMSLSASGPNITTFVHPGEGEFLMDLAIGTPPLAFAAIMDTGSDLIWTQCQPCKQCFEQPTPIFNPKNSSSFAKVPCSSPLCSSLPNWDCEDGSCDYEYVYGDGSYTDGFMASETFTFENVPVQNVAFGCADDNELSAAEQTSGLVGLGRGLVSLVSQLYEPRFSYCLTSFDSNETSSLLMGSTANVNGTGNETKTTPMIKSSAYPSFYYLSLKSISVGDTIVPYNNSRFGPSEDSVILDSGTTLTILEQDAYDLVKEAFVSQTKLNVAKAPEDLDLCFDLPNNATNVEVPPLVYNFDGADIELPAENYFALGGPNLLCLTIVGTQGIAIVGNIQQQNMLVVYDLAKETISFTPTQCDKL